MNRRLTNAIRFVMDELIPPFIRDSKAFMYPFYLFAYRGKNIKEVMQFKTKVYTYSPEEYTDFYNGLNTISRNRATDLNQACIDFILDKIDPTAKSLVDIGCGGGYLLNKIHERHPSIALTGFDLKEPEKHEVFDFVHGNVERLPFEDHSIDVVVCCHTVEHLIKLDLCISELIRITRKQLFIVTPCQRYFYYTLDEHVNFFPQKESLTSKIPLTEFTCEKLQGDWAYLGTPSNRKSQ
jgi:ubiquinone/menaquinone biosynthesis C-methylase UbiE